MSLGNEIKVLIIEDETEIRDFLLSQFKESGFQVLGLPSGEDVLNAMEGFHPGVVLLDQMMPGKSGTEVIREIRSSVKFSETPIMMVTGLDGESEKIDALNSGADDYVTKPFSLREIMARVQALYRRSQSTHKSTQKVIELKDLTVDLRVHKVTHQGQDVPLTLTEFKILTELLKQSGQVLTRDSLREKALGNLNVTDRTIDVHMASLRKKLNDMGDRIETVRGVGYRMVTN